MKQVALLLSFVLLLSSCGMIKGLTVVEVVTSSKVSSAGLPLDPTSTFEKDAESIHLTVKVADVSREISMRTEWVFTDNFNEDGTRSDYVIDRGEAKTREDGIVHFALSKPDRGWPSGNYRVDIFVGSSDQPERTISFVVL